MPQNYYHSRIEIPKWRPQLLSLRKECPRVSKNCSNCAKSSHLATLARDKWGCLTDDLIIALVSSHHERCPFVNITCVEVGLVRQKEQKAFNGVTKVTADLNPDVQAGTVTEAALTQAITDMVELLGQFGLNTVFHL